MSDAKKEKYDIDELVKSLLLERRSDLPDAPEKTDEEAEAPSSLLGLDEAVAQTEEEDIPQKEEPVVSPAVEPVEEPPQKEEKTQKEAVAESVAPAKEKPADPAPAPKKRRRLFARWKIRLPLSRVGRTMACNLSVAAEVSKWLHPQP